MQAANDVLKKSAEMPAMIRARPVVHVARPVVHVAWCRKLGAESNLPAREAVRRCFEANYFCLSGPHHFPYQGSRQHSQNNSLGLKMGIKSHVERSSRRAETLNRLELLINAGESEAGPSGHSGLVKTSATWPTYIKVVAV